MLRIGRAAVAASNHSFGANGSAVTKLGMPQTKHCYVDPIHRASKLARGTFAAARWRGTWAVGPDGAVRSPAAQGLTIAASARPCRYIISGRKPPLREIQARTEGG